MNRRLLLITFVALIGVLASRTSAAAQATISQGPNQVQAALGTGFTYQGQLKSNGLPVNEACDFQFSMWDAAGSGSPPAGGTRLGIVQAVNNVQVNNGLFSVTLNGNGEFGLSAFNGDARWIQIQVRCPAGNGSFTALSPRQPLTAVPYALGLHLPFAESVSSYNDAFSISNAGNGRGMYSLSEGHDAIVAESHAANRSGLYAFNSSADGFGAFGANWTNATLGILGAKQGVVGRHGESGLNVGPAGVWGDSNSAIGVAGTAPITGVLGIANTANNVPAYGVYGESKSPQGAGVRGVDLAVSNCGELSCAGMGVQGLSEAGNAVQGQSHTGIGVAGWSQSGFGIYGSTQTGKAGYFSGDVQINGNMSASSKSFEIDHPLDPANMYLIHSTVESSDMMDIYNGNVVLDAHGEAWVKLPAWFEALNKDFRYQLTPIGTPGPNLYVAQEVQNSRFKIAGGAPGSKVSWQVTGIRHDPYAEAHPIQVEQEKPPQERGKYLDPMAYGLPQTMGIDYEKTHMTDTPAQP